MRPCIWKRGFKFRFKKLCLNTSLREISKPKSTTYLVVWYVTASSLQYSTFFLFFFIKTTFHFNHILSCANHAHPVSEPLNLQNPLHYTCLTRLPAQSKCLKLPEAQIISLTSLKTHEMLRRRAVSLPLCLPQSSDSCHTSSSQMGISFHISFIFAQTHLQLWAYTAINTSLHSETWARMSV